MLRFLRFWADVHLAIGAGLELAAAQLEPFTPEVFITAPEDDS